MEILTNPLLQDILTRLRDRNTRPPEFRRLLETAGVLMAYEIARYLPTEKVAVETPLGAKAEGLRVLDEKVTVVAVLRAALPFAYGVLRVLPNARLGVVAARRVEEERADIKGFEMEVEVPYVSVPGDSGIIVLADPMLATGSTLKKVIETLKGSYETLIVVTVISTKLGIERVFEADPEALVLTLAVDPELNTRAYIVPGLGDAGDRAFG